MAFDQYIQRRKVLIDKKFQLQYLWIWLLTGVGVVICALGMWFGTMYFTGTQTHPLVIRVVIGMGVFVLLFCCFMGVLSVAMTHRVAGAAYRLEHCLDRMIEGEYTQKITLRRHDYLQTLAERLSQLQILLLRRQTDLTETLRQIETVTVQLDKDGKLPPEAKEALVTLHNRLNQIRTSPPPTAESAAASPPVAQPGQPS